MSILPVLGHKPITSYFSRTSSTKRKRKELDKPEPSRADASSKQPRISSFPSTSKVVSTRFGKGDLDEGPKFTKRDEVNFPSTPLDPAGKRNMGGTLPTPPMSSMAPFLFTPSSPPKDHELFNDTRLSGTSASFVISSVADATITGPEFTIPSSQSQDVSSTAIDVFSSVSKISRADLRPTEGENLIIESSQSQLLVMASPITRKLDLEPTLATFDVVVPSSQSQERELMMPTEKVAETSASNSSIGKTSRRGVKIVHRTLSDESFSVSIRDSILDNIFSAGQALDTPTAENNRDSHNPQILADSELEDEHDDLPNSCFEERNLEPTSWSPAARASSISESSFVVNSYSSLPPEVWEFRKMFENGDESYPADFPESLRS